MPASKLFISVLAWVIFACSLPLAMAGSSRPARMAIMAMTTSNSISVKPVMARWDFIGWHKFGVLGVVDRTKSEIKTGTERKRFFFGRGGRPKIRGVQARSLHTTRKRRDGLFETGFMVA